MTPPNVVLCPAAHVDAQANFERTVVRGIHRAAIPVDCAGKLADLIGAPTGAPTGAQQVRAWGVSPRHIAQWTSIKKGDVLLFAKNKSFFACTTSVGTLNSPDLSTALWNMPDWRLVILVAPPKTIDLPVAKLSVAIGYSPKFNVQRFHTLNADRSRLTLLALKAIGLEFSNSSV